MLAAGVVVFRPGRRVLVVHRPKYDDWSFPKGKLDRGEHATAAAVREVAEETGLHVRLCLPLSSQRYPIADGRTKSVHYWTGRAVGDVDVTGYLPNAEIDDVRWVSAEEAEELLTYPRDLATLAEGLKRRRKTRAVVVLRHSAARSRSAWRADDRDRPLLKVGEHHAERLLPLLAAYDVTRVLSSTSRRCVQTVEPFARTTGWELDERRRLSRGGRHLQGSCSHRRRRSGRRPQHGDLHPSAGAARALRGAGPGRSRARHRGDAGGPPAQERGGRHRTPPGALTQTLPLVKASPGEFT